MYYNPHVTDDFVMFREGKSLAQGPTANEVSKLGFERRSADSNVSTLDSGPYTNCFLSGGPRFPVTGVFCFFRKIRINVWLGRTLSTAAPAKEMGTPSNRKNSKHTQHIHPFT